MAAEAAQVTAMSIIGAGRRLVEWAAEGGKRALPRYNATMSKFAIRVTLAGLLVLSGCVSTGSAASEESITVSRRPWFAICVGVCPNYDVTVWADGRVLAVRHRWGAPDTAERFRVSEDEAARFRSILLRYRPTGAEQVEPFCFHEVTPEEADLVIKVREIEIVWSGPSSPSRLVACDTPALSKELRQALWSVHLHLDGNRRPD